MFTVPFRTLAAKMGNTHHLSPLLRRVSRRLGFKDIESALIAEAIKRGATAYIVPEGNWLPVDFLSDEELAVALMSLELSADTTRIRVAAQLLTNSGTDICKLIHLARMERVVPILRHICACATHYRHDLQPWSRMAEALGAQTLEGVLPHHSRFVFMPGIDRKRMPQPPRWLERKTAA